MHAIVGMFSMDRAKRDAQKVGLQEFVIPTVKKLPGFVRGYWSYDQGESRSFSYIIFQTEAQAKALVELLKSDASRRNDAGVQLQSLTIVEIWGEAQGA